MKIQAVCMYTALTNKTEVNGWYRLNTLSLDFMSTNSSKHLTGETY